MAEQIEGFLATEGQKAATGAALLGSSEAIESVFGSYKQYVERSVWSEIGSILHAAELSRARSAAE